MGRDPEPAGPDRLYGAGALCGDPAAGGRPVVKQPHLSGTLLILAGGASVLFAAGIHWGWFVAGGSIVGLGMWAIITLTPYMTARINLWLDPGPSGRGTAIRRCSPSSPWAPAACWAAVWATACRRCSTSGAGERLRLPHRVEELGFVGGLVVLILFALLILRGYWLALHARDKSGR